jgi:hypothetical protein
MIGAIIGLLILIVDIYGIVKTVQSSAGVGAKILWVLLILLISPLGIILWFFLGPGRK